MTKRLKNILISLFVTLPLLLAGFFFVGCGPDYSKISLVADQTSLEMEVGEQKEINIKIEGYQKGFSNKVTISKEGDGVFDATAQTISNSEIKVVVTAKAGGQGKLTVKTLEANKTCSVDIFVEQTSPSLSIRQDLFFVTQRSDFIPNANMFDFEGTTTNRELAFYYIGSDDTVDLNEYSFEGFKEKNALFKKGEEVVERAYVQVDRVRLIEDETLSLVAEFNGEQTPLDMTEKFQLLTIYQPSVTENGSASIFNVNDVFVLKALDVSILGGYLQPDGKIEQPDKDQTPGFESVFKDVENSDGTMTQTVPPITIVPNRERFVQYVLKLKLGTLDDSLPVEIKISKSNDDVVADFVSLEDLNLTAEQKQAEQAEEGNVKYIKISQNALRQTSTTLSLQIFYENAKDVEDQSVNFSCKFTINTEIAPSYITVNNLASSEISPFVLYNYNFGEYGWKEFYVDVISNFQSSPTFEGIYFTYTDQSLELTTYNGTPIVQNRVYTDIDRPFRVKGLDGIVPTDEAKIRIDVAMKGILKDTNIPYFEIPCEIKTGPRSIRIEEKYSSIARFYVDFEKEDNVFDAQLYTQESFETIQTRFVSGTDCVEIITNNQPCREASGKFYLNLNLKPKAVGEGKYEVVLDNGVSLIVTFSCKKFLKEETTQILMPQKGNAAVTASSFSSSPDVKFDNILNMEILNSSNKNSVSFGSTANFEIVANIDYASLTAVQDTYNFLNVVKMGNVFTITTRGNGDTKISFVLQGDRLVANDFLIDEKNPTVISLFVYVSSYSLAEEFYLSNSGSHAYSRNVYFGTSSIPEEEKRVNFSAVANYDGSNNFFQNKFDESCLPDIFENSYGVPGSEIIEDGKDSEEYDEYAFDISNENFNVLFKKELVHATFRDSANQFLTFSLLNSNGTRLTKTILKGKLTKYENGVPDEKGKDFQLVFQNGLMIWMEEKYEFAPLDNIRYELTFDSLVYDVDGYGTFDFDSLEYYNNFTSERTIIFSAQIEQRNKPQRFDAKISIVRYAPVESISLSNGTQYIDFSNQKLTETIGVYTYPLSSTNNDIQVQFVPTGEKAFPSMVQWTIDRSNASNGTFLISLSCEEFYANPSLHDGIPIQEIESALTGDLYIFPSDWGTSYTSLIENRTPIKLSLQYHNGSRKNPYILEDAEDIANINLNESTLSSHYEIRTNISLATTYFSTPIGILDGEVVGFSGSITGTTSQAGITNVFVTNSNLSATVNGKFYGGLFAQINEGATLENFTVSGKIEMKDLDASDVRIGLLVAQNRGQLLNVGANLDASSINGSAEKLYFGGLAGLNLGQIVQDMRYYDGTAYYYHQFVENVDETANGEDGKGRFVSGVGHVKKIKATFLEDSELGRCAIVGESKIRVDESGFAIDQNGIRIKFDEDGNALLSTRDFEGQTPRNMAFFDDETTIDVTGNVFAGGVVGASSGKIEKILPTAENFKLFGYSNYSAYARISVVGSPSKVALGGIVGLVSNYNEDFASQDFSMPKSDSSADDETGAARENSIVGLLVGGKLSTITLPDTAEDYVGGLVGYATTAKVNNVTIASNIARTFVKGIHNVGGLLGCENVSSDADISKRYITYGSGSNKNIFEAVDDGENSFAAASIIRVASEKFEDADLTKIFLIGNSHDNGREFDGDLSDFFEVSTYVERTEESISDAVTLPLNFGTKTSYYGDFLVVERNAVGDADWTYHILQAEKFSKKTVSLEIADTSFKMTTDSEDEGLPDVVFMYYFHVDGDLSGNLGASAQAEIERLNYVTLAMTEFYPFSFTNSEVSVSSVDGDAVSIDINGNITVNGPGLAEVVLSSILNTNVRKVIYIYVVNFFNKDISSSIFYVPSDKLDEDYEPINGEYVIYGDSYYNVYMQPDYSLSNVRNADGERFSASKEGILTYHNVSYVLSKNSELSPKAKPDAESAAERFSSFDIVGQKIVFRREKTPDSDAKDVYELIPILMTKITINGKEYEFYKQLKSTKVTFGYRETATAIRLEYDKLSMQTNQELNGRIFVESTNPPEKEMIFYRITRVGEDWGQSKEPENINFDETYPYLDYINGYSSLEHNLFALTFERVKNTNDFNFNLQINKESDEFKNRFQHPISGQYVFTFSSNINSKRVVEDSFILTLDEAELDYVSAVNYSDFSDLSTPDEIVEPGTKGFLEVSLNPVEAVFDRFTIRNNAKNDNAGAGKATFMFAYRTQTGYEELAGFGSFENGQMLTFTYDELIKKFENMKDPTSSDYVPTISDYVGKLYFTYFVASSNVADNVDMAFDIVVTPFGEGATQNATINLKTKLGSYAKFVLDNKPLVDDGYYVARGLSYDLSLEAFGFDESQVGMRVGNTGDFVLLSDLAQGREFGNFSIRGQDGKYVLSITSSDLDYDGKNAFEIDIETKASKILNQVTVENTNVLKIYVMEYVLNYQYVPGVNEDIVDGMRNGSVNIAVGNPFTPRLGIWDFLEYDSSNDNIVSKVETFVEQMTANVQWSVVFNGQKTILGTSSQTIKNDYYHIQDMTITPVKTYHEGNAIYHFEMLGYYRIANGECRFARIADGANTIFTEFVFDVHDQSTQDSPIPIYNYDELREKLGQTNGDGWFILMNDITIPNAATSLQNETENFVPISENFLGLDGNSFAFVFSGIYDFEGANAGIFGTVREATLLQNLTVRLNGDVTFRMHQESFNVGLLAAENQGIITNAQTETFNGGKLSVTSSVTSTDAIVAGLVAQNNGFITNSRTTLDIIAPFDLSGFVGSNAGHIASSYYRGASLENTATTTSERTAGFVLDNSGEIYTSYVSGDMTKDGLDNQGEQYYHGTVASARPANTITSGNNVSGFVYANSGTIADCYSNIYLYQNKTGAGFVFENSSNISRCFSTSVLTSMSVESFGFAQQNSIVDENLERQGGTIKDCYFLQHHHDSADPNDTDINFSIKNLDDDENADIMALDFENFQFSYDSQTGELKLPEKVDGRAPFENFIVTNGRNTNSVWFYNDVDTARNNFNGTYFNTQRLELVAPNIKASSSRDLLNVSTVVDPETGAETSRYEYVYHVGTATLGSEENPILVSNAEDFEKFFKTEADNRMNNFSHYRLVSDVDFDETTENSTLYDINFMGYLEGNFMSVEGISLQSSKQKSFAGLFAKIGGERDALGVLMNFTYAPSVVSFANTEVVGALAGKLDGGTIANIDLVLENVQNGIVDGKNIVGGLIGMAVGNFNIQHVSSEFGALARTQSTMGNDFDENASSFSSNSLAGSIAGALSGRGKIKQISSDATLTIMGSKVGLLFGFVDEQVKAQNIVIQVDAQDILNGYEYAGFVAGETKGTFENVTVSGSGDFGGFRKIPFTPVAVGGFAGLVSGGEFENIRVEQSIVTSTISSNTGISYIGGIAGRILGGVQMTDITVTANLVGFMYVGGVAGQISTAGSVAEFENLDVDVDLSALGLMIEQIGLGGLAGEISANTTVRLTNSLSENLGKLYDLYDEQNALQNQFDVKDIEIKAVEVRISALTQENEDLKARNAVLESEINGIQEQINSLDEPDGKDKETKTQLEAEKEEKENEKTRNGEQISNNEAKIEELTSSLSALNGEKDAISSQLTEKGNNINTLTSEFDDVMKQKNVLLSEKYSNSNKLAFVDYFNELNKKYNDLKTEIESTIPSSMQTMLENASEVELGEEGKIKFDTLDKIVEKYEALMSKNTALYNEASALEKQLTGGPGDEEINKQIGEKWAEAAKNGEIITQLQAFEKEYKNLEKQLADKQEELEITKFKRIAGVTKINEICGADAVKIEDDGSLSTQSSNAINSKIKDLNLAQNQLVPNLVKELNTFDVGAHVNIHIYESAQALSLSVGAIFGRNSGATYAVSDTFSSLHGTTQNSGQDDIVIEDLSQANPKENVSTLSVVADEITGEAQLSNVGRSSENISSPKTSIRPFVSSGTNCFATCSLSVKQGVIIQGDSESNIHLVAISICGDLFLEEI